MSILIRIILHDSCIILSALLYYVYIEGTESGNFTATFTPPKTMVDVGCGVGGSSRYISKKWGVQGQGKGEILNMKYEY